VAGLRRVSAELVPGSIQTGGQGAVDQYISDPIPDPRQGVRYPTGVLVGAFSERLSVWPEPSPVATKFGPTLRALQHTLSVMVQLKMTAY